MKTRNNIGLLVNAYKATPQWAALSRQMFDYKRNKCEQCGSSRNLKVVHKSLDNLYNETVVDLELICVKCIISRKTKKDTSA